MSAPLISLDLVPIGDDHAQKRDGIHHSTSSRAKNCAECRRLKVKCDRKVCSFVVGAFSGPLREIEPDTLSKLYEKGLWIYLS